VLVCLHALSHASVYYICVFFVFFRETFILLAYVVDQPFHVLPYPSFFKYAPSCVATSLLFFELLSNYSHCTFNMVHR